MTEPTLNLTKIGRDADHLTKKLENELFPEKDEFVFSDYQEILSLHPLEEIKIQGNKENDCDLAAKKLQKCLQQLKKKRSLIKEQIDNRIEKLNLKARSCQFRLRNGETELKELVKRKRRCNSLLIATQQISKILDR